MSGNHYSQISKTVKFPPTPPAILVGTRLDKLDSPARGQEICSSLFKQFRCLGNTVACIPVCAKDGNLSALEDCLIKTAISKQGILREKIPGSWVALDKTVCERRNLQTVRWREFMSWAGEVGIVDESKIKQAAQFLHGVGSIIYYESTYSKLGELVVLDPEYLAGRLSLIVALIGLGVMCTIVTFKVRQTNYFVHLF